jgi:hypothetical protein
MRNQFLRVLTASVLALSVVAPTFAACPPGGVNCIPDGGPGSRLAKAKHQVFDPGNFNDCDHDTTLCGNDIVSPTRTTTPLTPKSGQVPVAPAIR